MSKKALVAPSPDGNAVIQKFAVNQMYDSNDRTIVYSPVAICGTKKTDKHYMWLFIFENPDVCSAMVQQLNMLAPLKLADLADGPFKALSGQYLPLSKDYNEQVKKVFSRPRTTPKVIPIEAKTVCTLEELAALPVGTKLFIPTLTDVRWKLFAGVHPKSPKSIMLISDLDMSKIEGKYIGDGPKAVYYLDYFEAWAEAVRMAEANFNDMKQYHQSDIIPLLELQKENEQ